MMSTANSSQPVDLEALALVVQADGPGVAQARGQLLSALYECLLTEVSRFGEARQEIARETLQDLFIGSSGIEKSIQTWRKNGKSLVSYITSLFYMRMDSSLNQSSRIQSHEEQLRLSGDEDQDDEDGTPKKPYPKEYIGERHPGVLVEERSAVVLLRQLFLDEIARLEPAQYRLFLQFAFILDTAMSRQEMARLLEVPEGTLASGIKRAVGALMERLRHRLKQMSLNIEDLADVIDRPMMNLTAEADSRLEPQRLRDFVLELRASQSLTRTAEKMGISESESRSLLLDAVQQSLRIRIERRIRTVANWLTDLLSMEEAEWERLVVEGSSGDAPADRAFRRFGAFLRGEPVRGLRDSLLEWAKDGPGYGELGKLLGMDEAGAGAYIGGLKPLPEDRVEAVAQALGLSLDECRQLAADDQRRAANTGARSASSTSRKLLELHFSMESAGEP